jgi:hypothetical protein
LKVSSSCSILEYLTQQRGHMQKQFQSKQHLVATYRHLTQK